ncbi:MAG: hypothetical protein LBQ50_14205, partial [Planctomycetaceae bacterium]|nr:hypothetical protein [Planctomycetaceae bacterium]
MPTILETSQVPGIKLLYCLAVLAAAASGLFCTLFVALLFYNYHFSYYPVESDGLNFVVPDSGGREIPFFSSDP